MTFEGKMLHKICDPVHKQREWKINYNQKLFQLCWSLDIIRKIKVQGYNGQGIKQWVIMKCPKESWISDSKEGQCRNLNFGGRTGKFCLSYIANSRCYFSLSN
jgi:hypothetical protein